MASIQDHYDLIVVGTSFSASFFLKKYFERFGAGKVLVLDRGQYRSHEDMLRKREWTDAPESPLYIANPPGTLWTIRPSFGGNSNYWLGDTPRFLPSDFRTRSLFGVGTDWPIGYDDIEPDYTEVEKTMSIAGPRDIEKIAYRSKPFPQREHNLSLVDQLLKKAYPDTFFAMPTARAHDPTDNRNSCCDSNRCSYCPADARFRIDNEMRWIYERPDVELKLGARVMSLDLSGGTVSGVNYLRDGEEFTAQADLVVLAANPIFNTEIMLRSGDPTYHLGRGIMTHPWYLVTCLLDGIDNFQGGTMDTGICYELYGEAYRRDHAGCTLVMSNAPFLRPEFGRWRQTAQIQAAFEDVAQDGNYVDIDPSTDTVRVNYASHSDYTQKGRDALDANLAKVLSVLPIEEISISETSKAGGCHIMGTHRMGADPETSVIDTGLVHHRYRNLLLLGGGSFVTPSSANPTLTMSALSLRAARML